MAPRLSTATPVGPMLRAPGAVLPKRRAHTSAPAGSYLATKMSWDPTAATGPAPKSAGPTEIPVTIRSPCPSTATAMDSWSFGPRICSYQAPGSGAPATSAGKEGSTHPGGVGADPASGAPAGLGATEEQAARAESKSTGTKRQGESIASPRREHGAPRGRRCLCAP